MAAASPDALGFGRLVPGPGWVVLDAAREQRFTGELLLIADEAVRVYFERGQIYLAERATDPPLADRLVRCGALTPEQLDDGRLDIAGVDHLGRLFERAPTASRDAVTVATETMNDQVVTWLAGQRVHSVGATPYRHHGSGIHRWNDPAAPRPHSPWPAPSISFSDDHQGHPIDTAPVLATEPPVRQAPVGDIGVRPAGAVPGSATTDGPITAAGLDAPTARPVPTVERAGVEPVGSAPADTITDRAVPSATADPPSDDAELPPLPTRQVRQRPSQPSEPSQRTPDDDLVVTWDSAGPTGLTTVSDGDRPRPATLADVGSAEPADDDTFGVIWPTGEVAPLAGTTDDVDAGGPGTGTDVTTPRVGGDDGRSDGEATSREPVTTASTNPPGTGTLAVRRAVATIDTGSLAARRRLVASTQAPEPPLPTPELPRRPVPSGDDEASASAGTDDEGRPTALRRVLDNLRRD